MVDDLLAKVAVVLAVAVYAAGAWYVALDAFGRSRAWWVRVGAPALALLGGPLAVIVWLAARPAARPGWPGVVRGRWAPAAAAAGFFLLMSVGGWRFATLVAEGLAAGREVVLPGDFAVLVQAFGPGGVAVGFAVLGVVLAPVVGGMVARVGATPGN